MRAFFHLSCAVLALGCGTDTFVGPDSGGGGGDASGDVAVDSPIALDGATEAGVSPVDPNNLGNDLVLWLRAEDVIYDSGLKLASSWPDQSSYHRSIKLKTTTSPGACGTPGVYIHTNEIGTHSTVSFCGAVAEAADAPELQFGSDAPFVVATVIEPGSPLTPDDCVVATKSSDLTQGGFALVAPNMPGNQAEAYLLQSDSHVVGAVSGVGEYHIVTMVRRKGTNGQSVLTLRVDAIATNQNVPTQDVSESGAPFAIGGVDTGALMSHVIPGKVAEVLVVSNASSLADALPAGIDLYLKQKYGL